jgi:hypothetical protein
MIDSANHLSGSLTDGEILIKMSIPHEQAFWTKIRTIGTTKDHVLLLQKMTCLRQKFKNISFQKRVSLEQPLLHSTHSKSHKLVVIGPNDSHKLFLHIMERLVA